MAGTSNRTEPPTPRRLREARKRGQLAISRDFLAAAALAAAVGALTLCGGRTGTNVAALSRGWLDLALTSRGLSAADVQLLLDAVVHAVLSSVAPVAAAGIAVAAIAGTLQTGGYVSARPLAPKGERLSPASGLKRLVGRRAAVEALKAWLKFGGGIAALATMIPAATLAVARLGSRPPPDVIRITIDLATGVAWRAALLLIAFGAVDVLVQRRLHERDLRMSKDEVKRDYKEDEGDPLIKRARRQAHREIALQRMISAAGSASFVVVNPTHLATAIRYDDGDDPPRVVAKGAGDIARRIRRVAESSGVRIVYDKPLARALYRVPLDDEIPEALYTIVAELLALIRREQDTRVPQVYETPSRPTTNPTPMP